LVHVFLINKVTVFYFLLTNELNRKAYSSVNAAQAPRTPVHGSASPPEVQEGKQKTHDRHTFMYQEWIEALWSQILVWTGHMPNTGMKMFSFRPPI
jgi:hypothetical protein